MKGGRERFRGGDSAQGAGGGPLMMAHLTTRGYSSASINIFTPVVQAAWFYDYR